MQLGEEVLVVLPMGEETLRMIFRRALPRKPTWTTADRASVTAVGSYSESRTHLFSSRNCVFFTAALSEVVDRPTQKIRHEKIKLH
ncbi:unnamed protein product [Clavelina lepadiformis]|uniref:Uncharacterized protein n=1 Tax=Clavelina lepadiformis TaxID=159417 RepID=A0ABP0GIQ1_CLALP